MLFLINLRYSALRNRIYLSHATKLMPRRFFFFVAVLIRCVSFWGQVPKGDTLYLDKKGLDEIIQYGAKDSSYFDAKLKRAYLYGSAFVETQSAKIKAGVIVVDFNSNEIEASFRTNELGEEIEYPELTEGNETLTCHRLRLNSTTQKAYIEALSIKQEELYFHMGVAKRYPNEDIHLKQGVMTTCDQEEPHYHFQLSKAVVVPDKRIVTGPMNLWISGIPTPFGLPFAFIPQQKERTKGILFPEIVPSSPYGFGVQNLGYFIPINDHLQTAIYANLYSRGSFGIRNELDYAKRYGYSGRLGIGFQLFNEGFPDYSKNNKFTLSWNHSKLQKSNPYWQFNSNVHFISDNTAKNNLDPINPDYFTNSFNSDINVSRLFPGKPISIGSKFSIRQNALAKNIAVVSPIINLNMTRVFPFQKWLRYPTTELGKTIQRIGISYNLEVQNKSNFGDSLIQNLDFQGIGNSFLNGAQHNATVQTTMGIFKNALKLTPSFNYGTKLNIQQIDKIYNAPTNSTLIDTLQRAGIAHEFNFSLNATTVLYSYYRFVGKKKPILRHILTPSIGFRYVPKLNALVTKNVGPNQAPLQFSPFERSIYQVGNQVASSFLTFGINNSVELKFKSVKDTLTGYRKIRLIDQFSLNGNFDFIKDSMRLSDISMNLRVSPSTWINFVASGVLSPYAWNMSTGKTVKDFAWDKGMGLGRILQTGLNTTLTFSSKKSREIIEAKKNEISQAWNADYSYFLLHPEQGIYFDIPWKINLSHVYSLAANTNINATSPSVWSGVQTLALSGDVSFTKRWNIASNINVDVKSKNVTNMNLSLNRNMHCWSLSFFWTPIGGNKSFLLSIRNTSTLFRDAKVDIRRPPSFF